MWNATWRTSAHRRATRRPLAHWPPGWRTRSTLSGGGRQLLVLLGRYRRVRALVLGSVPAAALADAVQDASDTERASRWFFLERKISEPFCTTKDLGTGQGLAIAWSIVTRRHGGRSRSRAPWARGPPFAFVCRFRATQRPALGNRRCPACSTAHASWRLSQGPSPKGGAGGATGSVGRKARCTT